MLPIERSSNMDSCLSFAIDWTSHFRSQIGKQQMGTLGTVGEALRDPDWTSAKDVESGKECHLLL